MAEPARAPLQPLRRYAEGPRASYTSSLNACDRPRPLTPLLCRAVGPAGTGAGCRSSSDWSAVCSAFTEASPRESAVEGPCRPGRSRAGGRAATTTRGAELRSICMTWCRYPRPKKQGDSTGATREHDREEAAGCGGGQRRDLTERIQALGVPRPLPRREQQIHVQ